jgi:hypothetical protein
MELAYKDESYAIIGAGMAISESSSLFRAFRGRSIE